MKGSSPQVCLENTQWAFSNGIDLSYIKLFLDCLSKCEMVMWVWKVSEIHFSTIFNSTNIQCAHHGKRCTRYWRSKGGPVSPQWTRGLRETKWTQKTWCGKVTPWGETGDSTGVDERSLWQVHPQLALWTAGGRAAQTNRTACIMPTGNRKCGISDALGSVLRGTFGQNVKYLAWQAETGLRTEWLGESLKDVKWEWVGFSLHVS